MHFCVPLFNDNAPCTDSKGSLSRTKCAIGHWVVPEANDPSKFDQIWRAACEKETLENEVVDPKGASHWTSIWLLDSCNFASQIVAV